MVTGPDRPGQRYVSKTDGAPPIPPPGGYRNAKRVHFGRASVPVTKTEDKPKSSWLGIIALCVAIVFALVLTGTLTAGSTDALYNVNMLAAQFVVLVLIVVSLFTKAGRGFAVSALSITLVLNVATVGALGAVQTAATGTYADNRPDADRFWDSYPGIKDVSADAILSQDSLEEIRTHYDGVMKKIREELTAKYGFTWTSIPEAIRPERNGYGGESMLKYYRSTQWFTNEPITGTAQKTEVMNTIDDIISEYDMGIMALNDPSYGFDEKLLTSIYGSTDPNTQVIWEWAGRDWDPGGSFYADIIDLANDSTGAFLTSREAMQQLTGEPLEGLQLFVIMSQVLSEDDVDDFRDRIKDYP